MKIFQGENPSALQLEIINELMGHGDIAAPRGKTIRELRPVSVEFLDPLKRVTFVRGRRINPYFQLAESLWIISGMNDVEFLDLFNKNMVNFSDDGKYFNASYGERIRSYGKNDLHGVIFNPVDQLEDCYLKLTADKDTRQAVIVISNPHFDNSTYTIKEQGKDIACNLVITFKIRHNKLHMTVFNRSNDVIWGLFGANLCQFSTIQELLSSWLGVEVGTYHQISDSLHIYTEDYGSDGNQAIFDEHPGIEDGQYSLWDMIDCEENIWWNFDSEPRMSMTKEVFDAFLQFFWVSIAPKLKDDEFMKSDGIKLLEVIHDEEQWLNITDDYWRMAISAMVAYRFIRLKEYDKCIEVLNRFVPDCTWKVSMVYFLKTILEKNKKLINDNLIFDYNNMVGDLILSCKNDKESLASYIDLDIPDEDD